MTQIPNVAEETKERIKRSSAYSLPNNPTGAGYKPQDIKNALFKPIVDGQYSVLAEIERLINELNKVLPSIQINRVELTEDDTLKIIDEKGETVTEIELPYNKKNDSVKDIELSCNREFKLSAKLKNENGDEIATSNEIDLPIESLVIGAEYYDGKIILLLQNDTSIAVEISDLVSGLVNKTDFESFQNDINGEIYNLQNGITAIDQYATENINNLYDKVDELEQNSGGGGNITVEQEVNESENPVSSKAVWDEFGRFSHAYDQIINNAVVKQEYFSDEAILDVVNNKDYHTTEDISNLLIRIPSGNNILCSIMFKTADSGTVTISIDGVKGYIGKAPDLEENGVTWELSIHNGIIASGKVVSE